MEVVWYEWIGVGWIYLLMLSPAFWVGAEMGPERVGFWGGRKPPPQAAWMADGWVFTWGSWTGTRRGQGAWVTAGWFATGSSGAVEYLGSQEASTRMSRRQA